MATQPGGLLPLVEHSLLPLAPTLGFLKREIGFRRRGECEQFGSFEKERARHRPLWTRRSDPTQQGEHKRAGSEFCLGAIDQTGVYGGRCW